MDEDYEEWKPRTQSPMKAVLWYDRLHLSVPSKPRMMAAVPQIGAVLYSAAERNSGMVVLGASTLKTWIQTQEVRERGDLLILNGCVYCRLKSYDHY